MHLPAGNEMNREVFVVEVPERALRRQHNLYEGEWLSPGHSVLSMEGNKHQNTSISIRQLTDGCIANSKFKIPPA